MSVPEVRIIAASGDVVTDATAIAYISLGKVIEVEITNAGSGYTQTPTIVFAGGGGQAVQAKAYAKLTNDKVRANTIGVKFDRVSGNRELGTTQATDQFLCDNSVYRFTLSWAAENKKSNITVTLDKVRVLAVNYDIVTYTSLSNCYHKLYSDIVLNFVPIAGQILEVTYNKNINLYHAAERVQDYYAPTDGMAGQLPAQVMSGIDYPGTELQTLPFTYTPNWDMLPFTEAGWDDDGNGEQALDTILDGSQWTDKTIAGENIVVNRTYSGANLFAVDAIEYPEFQEVDLLSATWRVMVSTSTNTTVVLTGIDSSLGSVVVYATTSSNTINFGTVAVSTATTTKVAATGTTTLYINTLTNVSVGRDGYWRTISATAGILIGTTITNVTTVYDPVKQGYPIQLSHVTTGTVSTSSLLTITYRPYETDYSYTLVKSVAGNLGMMGINPEDMIVDGDTFISPNVSHGPEELVPGEVVESVAMTVYTRVPSGSPTISQTTFMVDSTDTSTTHVLSMLPPSTSSLMVSFNRNILDYGTDYTVNFNNKTITVSTQTVTGLVAATIVGVGGADYASSNYVTASNTSTITVQSGVPLANIKSVYVTLNGNTLTTDQYTLSKKGVTVTGLTEATNTVQAWFFESIYKGYSEVKEQKFVTYSTVTSFVLTQYPGVLGPINSQAIVELDKRRLIPPNTAYYVAAANQLFFDIDPNNNYPSGVYSLGQVQVHINGKQIVSGVDFILDQPNNRIKFLPGFLTVGDAVAITNTVYSEYYFDNDRIYLNTLKLTVPDNGSLKVITYTNHDSDVIRTEVFTAAGNLRRYLYLFIFTVQI